MSRRVVIILASLAVLIALAVAPWTISSPRLKEQVVRQLRDTYGLELVASGQTTIALLPVPRLKFTGITVANAEGTVLVEGAQLRGELQLLPLIAARLDLTDLSIIHGSLKLAIAADGSTSWDSVISRFKTSLTNASDRPRLRRLVVLRTKVVVDDARHGRALQANDVNLVVRWPARGAPVEATATATWNGEPVTASLSGLVPAELASGGVSHVDLHLASRRGEASFTGQFGAAEPKLDGEIVATTPSLMALLDWTGLGHGLPGLDHPVSVSGTLALDPSEIGLPRARLTIAGEHLDGAAAVRLNSGRRAIRATLAADFLDLSDVVQSDSPAWRSAVLDLAELRQADIDLRLSASAMVLGGLRLQDVAASLLTSAGRVEVSLGRANLGDGLMKGRLSIGCTGETYDIKLQSSLNQVDAGRLLGSFGGPKVLTGVAQGQATIEAMGSSADEIMRSMSGRVGLSVENGELLGMWALGARRVGDPAQNGNQPARRAAATPFRQFTLGLKLENGVAAITGGALESSEGSRSLEGQMNVAEQSLNVRARGPIPPEGGSDPGGQDFDVTGPWSSPSILPAPVRARHPAIP